MIDIPNELALLEWMQRFAFLWWKTLAPLAVQAAVLLCAVAVVDRFLPARTWPELRVVLWSLALLRLVLPPDLASPLSISRWLPELGVYAGSGSPFIIGLVRTHVFFPSTLIANVDPEKLEHALLHELAHLRRRDLWHAFGCSLLALVYWFHPLVWIAVRRLADPRELCCDRTVARVLGDGALRYRETLLWFARHLLDDSPGRGIAFVRPHGALVARLLWLENAASERLTLRRFATAVAAVFMLCSALPMARVANQTTAVMADWIDRPPGCLQLRFLVLKRLAADDSDRIPAPSNEPVR